MLNGLLTNYALEIFSVAALAFIVSRLVSADRRSRRKEKSDPPAIFGPIRDMYVCYQCDTVFSTTQCPGCNEEAVIPLIHLTGTISQDERVAAIADRMKARANWKLAPSHNEQAILPASAVVPKLSNGDASEVPVRFLYSEERGSELS